MRDDHQAVFLLYINLCKLSFNDVAILNVVNSAQTLVIGAIHQLRSSSHVDIPQSSHPLTVSMLSADSH